ncbi:hypothetical protein MKX03_011605 [Papaver bracteatum]|nr:hypothetical protein MKX03_011605 [Papaver bracteatum]
MDFEAKQIFYSQNLKNPDWSVVIHSPMGMTRHVDDLIKPDFEEIQSVTVDEPNLAVLLVQQVSGPSTSTTTSSQQNVPDLEISFFVGIKDKPLKQPKAQ